MAVEPKIEHLKFVQAVIARMGSNSFLLKGWTVTLVAALFAFSAKEADRTFVLVAWIPLLIFTGLDSYYLWHERLFRALHTEVATKHDSEIDYSMDVSEFKTLETWRKSALSKTILGFYIPVAVLLFVFTLYFALSPRAQIVPVQGPKTITISIQ